ncbi:hypothetical protein NDU88_010923 [Pleurodeles waltl]|uniref:Uncharacterized protein n=1 Tax=Pleurodeles waltl TaxID=8319 RepID=A0AAV7QZS0_PLEWA|nr:hypothetical protein NDU88_010923 [Pleurodeles waltl]
MGEKPEGRRGTASREQRGERVEREKHKQEDGQRREAERPEKEKHEETESRDQGAEQESRKSSRGEWG